MKFIVVGVQRSGTNYCTQILKSLNGNSQSEIIETGDREYLWKHSLPKESGKNYSRNFNTPLDAVLETDLVVILIHKNPVWWLSSIINRNSADLFRQRSFIYNEDDVVDVKKSLVFYADFYRQWLDLVPADKIIHVSYHEILNDYSGFVSRLNKKYDINLSGDLDVGSLKVPYSKGGYESRKEIYNKSYYDLPKSVLDECHNALTPALINQYKELGYLL